MARIIAGGKRAAGRQDDPLGGYWAQPRRYWAPGMAIAGDGAGMVNIPTLKGVHYAMHAGMFAAEAIVERLKAGGEGTSDLSSYQPRSKAPRSRRTPAAHATCASRSEGLLRRRCDREPDGDLRRPHPGRALEDPRRRDHRRLHRRPRQALPEARRQDDVRQLSSVFATGNATRDDAPNHIRVQERVPLEIALMWQNMCPAAVYEVPEEEIEAARADGNGKLDGKHEVKLQITPSNCVQCGAITAKGGA